MHGRRLASGRARLGRRSSAALLNAEVAHTLSESRLADPPLSPRSLRASRPADFRWTLFCRLSTAIRRSGVRGLASPGLALVDPLGQLVQRPGCHRLPRWPAVTGELAARHPAALRTRPRRPLRGRLPHHPPSHGGTAGTRPHRQHPRPRLSTAKLRLRSPLVAR